MTIFMLGMYKVELWLKSKHRLVCYSLSVYIVILTNYVIVTSHKTSEQCDLNNEDCFSQSDTSNWKFNYVTSKQAYIDLISQGKSGLINPYRAKEGLARRKGIHVGHVANISFQNGQTVDVITRAMRPLLFEIPNFLTEVECNHIIRRAEDPNEGRMFRSTAKGGLTPEDVFKPTGKKGKSLGIFGEFSAWDRNKDGFIDMQEITVFIHASQAPIILLEKDVQEMFTKLGMDEYLRDGIIDSNEFNNLDTIGMEEYVNILAREHPRFKQRTSMQTWLSMDQSKDKTLHHIRERLVEITGLGREQIYGGERLQVVHYQPYGHYHAHYDSETHKVDGTTVPCCHLKFATKVPRCRLCRYLTFMMYLSDVEEGGETAFPIADEGPVDERIWDMLRGNSSTDKFNLSHGCKRANLVIRPRKGSALLWYNHLVNETDGWMGERDLYSLHGGCDVIKGEKWISNMWIPAPFADAKGIPSLFLNWHDLYQAESQATK